MFSPDVISLIVKVKCRFVRVFIVTTLFYVSTNLVHTYTHTHTHTYIYIYIYCGTVKRFGAKSLLLKGAKPNVVYNNNDNNNNNNNGNNNNNVSRLLVYVSHHYVIT